MTYWKRKDAFIRLFRSIKLRFIQGPETARETSFAHAFGRDLHEAREACRRFRIFGETAELDKAWDIYYGVSALIDSYTEFR